MAKTAEKETKVAKEVVELTPEQKIAEIRNLRAGGLPVLNGTYVDALLHAYDVQLQIAEQERLERLAVIEETHRVEERHADQLEEQREKYSRLQSRLHRLEDEKDLLSRKVNPDTTGQ